MWGGSGSVLDPDKQRLYETRDGKTIPLKYTKWTEAFTMSDSQLEHKMWRLERLYGTTFTKQEVKKQREVINVAFKTFFMMDCISKLWWNEYIKGSKASTLWMTQEQRMEMWEQLATMNGWNMPLDQAEFDQQQLKAEVDITIDEMRNVCWLSTENKQLDDLFGVLQYNMEEGMIKVGDKLVPYKNGVLSGLRWTADIDTIINEALRDIAIDMAHDLGIMIKPLFSVAQGDDDVFNFGSKQEAIAMAECYKMMNFKVNPTKFFIRQGDNEFLRKRITNGVVMGYAARSVVSLLFRNVAKEEVEIGPLAANTIGDKWLRFSNRLDVPMLIGECVFDIAHANHWNDKETRSWLFTPAALGGFGFGPSDGDWYMLPEIKMERGKIKDNIAIKQFAELGDQKLTGEFVVNTTSPTKVVLHDLVMPRPVDVVVPSNNYSRKLDIPRLRQTQYNAKLMPIRSLEQILSNIENTEEIEFVTRNMTKRMKDEFIREGISATCPRVQGWSTEYLSSKWQTRRENIFARLLANNATIKDYQRAQYAEEVHWQPQMSVRIAE